MCRDGHRGRPRVPFPPCAAWCLGAAGSPPSRSKKEHNISSFADFGISNPVVRALASRDITDPFPVQQLVIADALARPRPARPVTDRLGQDPRLRRSHGRAARARRKARHRRSSSLPTRELAGQIADGSRPIARCPSSRVAAGLRRRRLRPAERRRPPRRHPRRHPGPPRGPDLARRRLARSGPHPRPRRGRPHARHGLPARRRADRRPDARPSARRCSSRRRWRAQPARSPPPTPAARAGTPTADGRDKADIEHRFLHVDSQSAKLDHLVAAAARRRARPARSSSCAPSAAPTGSPSGFARRNVDAVAMHGDKSQSQRERALARFERGDVDALIATDVAARGIDVDRRRRTSINFDAPGDHESYVHRIGRTGRAGRRGMGTASCWPTRPTRCGASPRTSAFPASSTMASRARSASSRRRNPGN